MAEYKLLLTGATGFIGGTVLQQLIETTAAKSWSLSLTAVVRRSDQADLLNSKGVHTILVSGLDDTEALEKAASEHDIVVNVALGRHYEGPKSLIRGLAKRREQKGADVHFIHLSGTTCIAAPSFRPYAFELRTFSDKDTDIYDYELSREAHEAYDQRTADVAVIQLGEALNVKTYISMPPTVYGRGTGWFKTQSHQVPNLIQNAIRSRCAEHIGSGLARTGLVHVVDLARLFALLVTKVLEGQPIPNGKDGYYFSNAGDTNWLEVTTLIGRVGFELGALDTPQPRSISLEVAAEKIGEGDVGFTETCFASNTSTRPEKSLGLGWKPLKTQKDWEESIRESFEAIVRGAH
ncbi:NAD dependent epimerase/dehydratase [Penicillium frequentans]|uniref:NAD dependent epimerase/dehydratase n=1 Tax=Penicillium frequentans TaxID=3151616 RepID=A0AAD6G951_9EURO|nr:NAD dependent epimerase/dehydratase [Penicillium glabrum]